MRPTLLFASVLAALALVSPTVARADVAPPDGCSAGQVGKACGNAIGTGGSTAGVCRESTCLHPTPDGSTSYTCYRCLADDGGAAGGAGNGSAGASPSPTSPAGGGSNGGCAIRGTARDGALASLMLAVGLGALAIQRRRRT